MKKNNKAAFWGVTAFPIYWMLHDQSVETQLVVVTILLLTGLGAFFVWGFMTGKLTLPPRTDLPAPRLWQVIFAPLLASHVAAIFLYIAGALIIFLIFVVAYAFSGVTNTQAAKDLANEFMPVLIVGFLALWVFVSGFCGYMAAAIAGKQEVLFGFFSSILLALYTTFGIMPFESYNGTAAWVTANSVNMASPLVGALGGYAKWKMTQRRRIISK